MSKLNDVRIAVEVQKQNQAAEEEDFDYSERAQWLRAAVLGANDGLVSIGSLMMGVGAVKADARVMILAGFAGLVAGACSMTIGEFVSVYSQLDIELAQMKRENGGESSEEGKLPNPMQAAIASALAFTLGEIVPLIAGAFIGDYKVRLGVVVAAVSMALVVFAVVGAILGRGAAGQVMYQGGVRRMDCNGHHFWADQVHWLKDWIIIINIM